MTVYQVALLSKEEIDLYKLAFRKVVQDQGLIIAAVAVRSFFVFFPAFPCSF
jgi:hypothetical protein